ncbi:hypothetical protein [Mycoplasmopsis columboralis]|uniref:Uncharacterized protein n=1 Tax=Mycoplasmopsis columboralis TaxID=171282 RepID=A0A449B5Z8_9BACT|nr:hypothetical protein [Mycoplasmopsis columboralis]VEU75989.1 Uncharacterised protein [Mycoplasmopsis columboralis]
MLNFIREYFIIRNQKNHFYFWKNRLNFVLLEFVKMDLLNKTSIQEWIKFDGKKWSNLDEFINEFNSNLSFSESLSYKHKQMLHNFFIYFFYQLSYKTNSKKIKIIFLEEQPYLKKDKVLVNEYKRSFYYQFLNEFKEIDNYNVVLRKILRKIK